MNRCNSNKFDNNYNSLGDYIRSPLGIPIRGVPTDGKMIIPVFKGYTAQDYANPNYDSVVGANNNNYNSVTDAYKQCGNSGDNTCVTYQVVSNPCNSNK